MARSLTFLRALCYVLLALALASTIDALVPEDARQTSNIFNLVLASSFLLAGPLLDRSLTRAPDDAYLYYLGVSGFRMLTYMAALGIALYLSPELRNRQMVLLLTSGFCCYTIVEVTFFLRKLREIFKNSP